MRYNVGGGVYFIARYKEVAYESFRRNERRKH